MACGAFRTPHIGVENPGRSGGGPWFRRQQAAEARRAEADLVSLEEVLRVEVG
jgi:hypothetical protein